MVYRVDLNCDLGESFGNYYLGLDREVLNYVTSANVACGWHAGDPLIMDETVALCKDKGVALGAHPGYPDLMGFGRRAMKISPAEAKAYMLYQVGALDAFAKFHGIKLQHVKLHGAFYNTACVEPVLADAVLDGVASLGQGLKVMALSGSYMAKEAERRGVPVIQEVFADRGYTDKGTLVPRDEEGAFIKEPEEALERVLRMITEGRVISNTGHSIPIQADSICLHGDNPEALVFAQTIREGLEDEGIQVLNFQSQ